MFGRGSRRFENERDRSIGIERSCRDLCCAVCVRASPLNHDLRGWKYSKIVLHVSNRPDNPACFREIGLGDCFSRDRGRVGVHSKMDCGIFVFRQLAPVNSRSLLNNGNHTRPASIAANLRLLRLFPA